MIVGNRKNLTVTFKPDSKTVSLLHGEYICNASNYFGSTETKFRINFKGAALKYIFRGIHSFINDALSAYEKSF